MNLRITPRALAEAKRIKTWWRRHRLDNPALFENELEAALERIVAKPNIGIHYEGTHLKVPVLRLLMPRTKNHVYYAVQAGARAGKRTRVIVKPDPGVDVNLYAFITGTDTYYVPPYVVSVPTCEASYPQGIAPPPNPGSVEEG